MLLGSATARTFRSFYRHAALLAICAGLAAPALAQGLPGVPQASPGGFGGLRQQGLYVTAPVTIDGQPVIRIAALAKGGVLPIDTRVLLVENALGQVLAQDPDRNTTVYDPKSFRIDVRREGSQYALEAVDDRHPAPLAIATVTSNDANAFGVGDRDLALQWQAALQSAVRTALQKRQPENIRGNLFRVLRAAAALAVVTVGSFFLWLYLRARIRSLKRQIDERQHSMEEHAEDTSAQSGEDAEKHRRRTLALGLRAAGPEQRVQRLNAYASSLIWLVVLLWAVGITRSLFLFPQTTAAGQFIVSAFGRILVVWIVAVVIDRLLELAIVHFADLYAHRGGTSEERARHALRAPTISRAVGGFKTVTVFFVALLVTLSQLQIPIASVVTIGGIAALAIGFAAQTLVKDVLNGLLVLIEDQYVVGDYVMVGDYNGIVENLTLRVLQLRDMRGYLITIPHSSVTQVVNASRNWARIDYRIAIDPQADLKKAVDVLRDTLEGIGNSDAWSDAVLEPVEWVGVELVANDGIVLRASIRTAPLRQFDLRRVINEQMFEAFKREDIALGVDRLGTPVPPPQGSPNPL